jgi:ABC-2 type transport system ATP-binding protein
LRAKAIRRLDLEFREPVDPEVFERLEQVRSISATGALVSLSFDGEIGDVLRIALDHDVVNLNSREADLEEIFLAYYRGEAGTG